MSKRFNPNKIGDIRPNQLITTFGPGAILDAVKDSVTVLDTAYWKNTGTPIYDSRLASYFGVDHFCPPRTSYDIDLPVVSFPNYHVCSNTKCNRLFDIHEKFNIDTYNRQGPTCPDCGFRAYPARFVIACKDGHLDDFPWRWWAHKGATGCNKKLKLYSTGETSTLAEMIVECECGKARRSMSGATDRLNFSEYGYTCTGHHPHKPNSHNEKCGCKDIFPSQRGATNIYFPVLRSAISIPPWTNPLYLLLDEHWLRLCEYENDFGETGVNKIYENYFTSFPRDEFNTAVNNRKKKIKEFIEIKEMEYAAFTHHADPTYKKDVKYFKAKEELLPSYLEKYFSRLIMIERLREVMVLQGFMRIDPPEPEADNLKNMIKLNTKKPDSWLPGVEIHGEGIFIEFNKDAVSKWLSIPAVKKISSQYKEFFERYSTSRGWENMKERNGEYVLLHTFAHLIIKEMSLQSGYSSTAIRERIYSSSSMCGVLFYTGSSDKEGSLGGLVELGEESKFRKLIKAAIENALLCTTDPECSNSHIDPDNLNGSACHSCCMIAETACENGNRLLDRSLIVPLDGKEELSYFKDMVGELCGISL
ncbi:hypothetical protein AGMMS49587_15350 [Spirochaetia bacterium]|nr:hypothetical protein AGMMS49587_15350 [Spirochaetia bacterium]